MVESMIIKAKRRGGGFGVEVKRGRESKKMVYRQTDVVTNIIPKVNKSCTLLINSYINLGKQVGVGVGVGV